MSVYDEYKKQLIAYSKYMSPIKAKVDRIVAEKGLVSLMNDTKWLELKIAVETLSFPPPYLEKMVTHDEKFIWREFNGIPKWVGCWDYPWEEGLPMFFNIQQLKVLPKFAKFRGRLVEDEILDETENFERILKKIHIPYEREGDIFSIYGYK